MKTYKRKKRIPLCKCGCGQPVSRPKSGKGKGERGYNLFVLGHNAKKNPDSPSNNVHNGQFKKGNKFGKGRKHGSRNTASIAIDATFEGEAERLTRKCIELALQGNVACLKTAIERIAPVKKSAPIKLEGMPKVKDIQSAGKATEFILQSIAAGKVSALDGEVLSRVLKTRLHSLQLTELEAELQMLKEKLV